MKKICAIVLKNHSLNDLCICVQTRKRGDDAADKYLQNSIKENIRNIRGKVSRRTFDDDDTTILPDFKSDFLTHRQNKNDLHIYLADKIVKFRKITI